MTTTSEANTAPTAEEPGAAVPSSRRIVARVTVRWAILLTATAVAYRNTLAAVVDELHAQTLITYLPVALLLIAIALIGVSMRNDDELPIYDRQTDVIVGGIVLILAASLQAMLNVRYDAIYLTIHIDLLSLWLFVLSGAILIFGLRPTARYRWVWLLGLSIFPFPFRTLVLAFGSDRYASSLALLLLAVGCSAVAVGRSPRHALIGATIATGTGLLTLLMIVLTAPELSRFWYSTIPSLVAAFTTGALMYVDHRRDASSFRIYPHRGVNRLTSGNVTAGAVLLAVGAVLIGLVPVPAVQAHRGPLFTELDMRLPLVVPQGWKQVDAGPLGFDRYYGRHAHSARQTIEQTSGDLRFDKAARPRTVVIDVITTDRPITLDVYPPMIVYDTIADRTSAARSVRLAHGVAGTVETVVDDKRMLTFNRLTWRWHNGVTTMQVTLFSVDNHLPGAPFPEPARNPLRVISPMLTVLLRGNAVTTDETPSFKDQELLTECADDLIETQLAVGRAPR